tara:strand:+ start:1045 stop:1386 length:342 start_codon:yes stop_codon:yes gene_type:complete
MNAATALRLGALNRGKEMMVFDWDKAAQMIKETQPSSVRAGLDGDMAYSGGLIFEDGKILDDRYLYLASTWAVPILVMGNHKVECYVMESTTEWDEFTKWPDSARKIMEDYNE